MCVPFSIVFAPWPIPGQLALLICLVCLPASPTALAADAGASDGRTEVARAAPAHAATAGTAEPDAISAIDARIADGWQRAGVQPSGECDDATFVRRIYLDLAGRIPTRSEAGEFLEDMAAGKRERLIDQLLSSDEFAETFASRFDTMLMGRARPEAMTRRQRHGWHQYLVDSFRENRPWNQMARDMTLARDSETTDVRAGWFLYERRNEYQAIAEAVAPAFFGIRIECAQCHDHPLASEIHQAHYWGLVAFFNRGKNQDTSAGPRVAEKAVGGFQKFTDLAGDSFETQLTFFESPVVGEDRPPEDVQDSDELYLTAAGELRVPKFSRRAQFADQILADHPLLARAFVNRIWAMLVGRGFVHPVDRMDSMHPPSHPELLEWLSNDFRTSGYDVKRLVRHVVSSRCYQLDSCPPAANLLPELFAVGLTKPIDAESLVRSLDVVLNGAPSAPEDTLLAEARKRSRMCWPTSRPRVWVAHFG